MPGSSSRKKTDPSQVRLIETKGSIVHSKLRTQLIIFILSSSVDFFQSKFANVCKWTTEFSFDRLGRKWEVSCIYLKLTRWYVVRVQSPWVDVRRESFIFNSIWLTVRLVTRTRQRVTTRQSEQGFYLHITRSNVFFFSTEEKRFQNSISWRWTNVNWSNWHLQNEL